MFKVTKERGYSATVAVIDTDTSKGINIGRPTIPMFNILSKEGYSTTATTDDKVISTNGAWDFTVSKATADELVALAMPIKRPPKREQPPKEKEVSKADGDKPVDVFDLIFGTSNI